jgi:hypothetical protein
MVWQAALLKRCSMQQQPVDSRILGRNTAAIGCFLILALFAATSTSPLAAADPSPNDLLSQQLQAGEFSSALTTARSAPNAADRNAMLAKIAKAQSAFGNQAAALQTIGQMDDDRVATDTLSGMKTQPAKKTGSFGGSEADFDPLIDLITSTVAPQTWSEMGGPGTISPFPEGVLIDPQGVLRPKLKTDHSFTLTMLREASHEPRSDGDARGTSSLRKISLVKLERQVQLLAAQGQPPTEEMQTLGGLQRIKYVLVYPDEGDIVLAGPAGDWRTDFEGRVVSKETGHPVLRLDDFVVVLRRMMAAGDAQFGCNITPTSASLAAVKEFVAESNKTPLKPGQRDGWLKQLRDKLGKQNIEVYGIDPRTRVGLTLVEADYRMKLVGMGLEESVPGVQSYLSSIELAPGQKPPPMDVLRWWFTLNYDAVAATPDHDAFELRGQGVQVLSENEMLTAAGQQVHTGSSDVLNQQFAHGFTQHFADFAIKYPIYAELQNICDMALVGALLQNENLPDKVRWHMLCFGDPAQYQVPLSTAPKTVDTVINHRVLNGTTIIVGISGGVRIDAKSQLKTATMKADDYRLPSERIHSAPKSDAGRERWWWD